MLSKFEDIFTLKRIEMTQKEFRRVSERHEATDEIFEKLLNLRTDLTEMMNLKEEFQFVENLYKFAVACEMKNPALFCIANSIHDASIVVIMSPVDKYYSGKTIESLKKLLKTIAKEEAFKEPQNREAMKKWLPSDKVKAMLMDAQITIAEWNYAMAKKDVCP